MFYSSDSDQMKLFHSSESDQTRMFYSSDSDQSKLFHSFESDQTQLCCFSFSNDASRVSSLLWQNKEMRRRLWRNWWLDVHCWLPRSKRMMLMPNGVALDSQERKMVTLTFLLILQAKSLMLVDLNFTVFACHQTKCSRGWSAVSTWSIAWALLEELITFRSGNVHIGDCRKWKCPHLLHDKAVETIDALTNKAKFYIGEMQKPNVILKPSLSRTRMTSKELKLEQRKIRNPRMNASLEHDVEFSAWKRNGTWQRIIIIGRRRMVIRRRRRNIRSTSRGGRQVQLWWAARCAARSFFS